MRNDKKLNQQLILDDGFVIYGNVIKENESGVWFETPKSTHFFNYSRIKEIRPLRGVKGDK